MEPQERQTKLIRDQTEIGHVGPRVSVPIGFVLKKWVIKS